jgi:hypothetical protein
MDNVKMRNLKKLFGVLFAVSLFASASLSVQAVPLKPATKLELASVLTRLEASGCQFNRNGTWFSSVEARAHLQRKFDYVEQKTSAQSTEEYIALAATKSSLSGTPYQVQCGAQPAVNSASWLLKQMQEVRSANPKSN